MGDDDQIRPPGYHHAGEDEDEQPEAGSDEAGADASAPRSRADLPYIYRRDKVTDEREQLPFYLRAETRDTLNERLMAFEDRLGEDVSTIDFRELALLVGVEHLDEMAKRAREWGYGMD